MIPRTVDELLINRMFQGKALVLIGARQVGKTTLVNNVIDDMGKRDATLMLNGDEPDIRAILGDINSSELKRLIGNHSIVVIDEAQRINNVGLTIKLLVDNWPDIQVIATGSSSLEIAGALNEPLTGRKYEYNLYPLSVEELIDHFGYLEEKRALEQRLLFGSYPEVVTNDDHAEELLKNLGSSYLYKDVLTLHDVRHPDRLDKLIRALALQIGQMVSYNELSQVSGLDKETVERYIQLLEQAYVLYRLPSFSRNIRNELKKSRKIYFYDTGIRNAVLGNFTPIANRNDKGHIWENYLLSERIKQLANHNLTARQYFWRTSQQQEIDYVEEREGKLHAYEFKFSSTQKANISKTFTRNYPGANIQLINKDNYINFLTELE